MIPTPSPQSLRAFWQNLSPPFRAAVVMSAAAILWVASGVFRGGDGPPAGEPKGDTIAAVQTRVLVAEDRLGQVSLTGKTKAFRGVVLKAETAGRVQALVVGKGARVAKGAEIVRLAMDNRPAKLAEAAARVETARIDYQGAKALSKEGYRSKLKLAESKAQLESAEAALEAAQLDADRTIIRAPFAGIADDIPVEIGASLSIGDEVARIIDLGSILVEANIAERYATRLQPGAAASVHLADGRNYQGTVRYVSRSSQSATRTFPIEVMIETSNGEVAEGLTAEVRLSLTSGSVHRISPAILGLSEEGVVGIKAMDENDTVRFIPVELVADTPEGMLVSGLPETVRVIVVGQDFVRVGQRVKPVDAGR